MRRFTKINSKKGFTLLEVLLATCILVIVSSMLMQGFITTMGFSYNSSVYARSAAWNSKLCVAQLGTWSANADLYQYDSSTNTFKPTKTAAYNDTQFTNSTTSKKINFGQGAVGSKLGSVSVCWGHDASDGTPRFDRWVDANCTDTVHSDYTAND